MAFRGYILPFGEISIWALKMTSAYMAYLFGGKIAWMFDNELKGLVTMYGIHVVYGTIVLVLGVMVWGVLSLVRFFRQKSSPFVMAWPTWRTCFRFVRRLFFILIVFRVYMAFSMEDPSPWMVKENYRELGDKIPRLIILQGSFSWIKAVVQWCQMASPLHGLYLIALILLWLLVLPWAIKWRPGAVPARECQTKRRMFFMLRVLFYTLHRIGGETEELRGFDVFVLELTVPLFVGLLLLYPIWCTGHGYEWHQTLVICLVLYIFGFFLVIWGFGRWASLAEPEL